MSNTFKIDLTSDMLLEELFFPLGEVYRTTDFSHLKHIDVPSNRMRAYAETAKKDIEEQITKNRLIAKEDRNSGAAPRYRDFSRGMMNGQHLSNRLFKANMYKLDNTNKCNMKDIVTNKTTKISTGGSWALYDFMNNLRGIRKTLFNGLYIAAILIPIFSICIAINSKLLKWPDMNTTGLLLIFISSRRLWFSIEIILFVSNILNFLINGYSENIFP